MWKKQQNPATVGLESPMSNATNNLNLSNDENLVELPIDEKLILELDNLYGGGIIKSTMDNNHNLRSKFLIKSSTAFKLFTEIIDVLNSHEEEAKFRKIEDDRNFALLLQEQEKADKYPLLLQESNNNFKDIMETQEALRDYEKDMNEWQVVEKPENMAQKLSKGKLYQVFDNVDRTEINLIFDAMKRDFKETVKVLKDSLGMSVDECKDIDARIAKTSKINEHSSEDDDDDDSSPASNDLRKRVEDLQKEIDEHTEVQQRCKDQANDHKSRKEFDTFSYYISMANLNKQLAEEKRHEYLNLLAELQKNNSGTILDLHYFKQTEAKIYLNTYLDIHISKLREVKKPSIELDIITGRGARSVNGIAALKNMAIKLFTERSLR